MRLFYLITVFLILANSYTFYEYINDVEDVMDKLALEISTFQLDETRNTSNVLRSSEQELLVPIANSAVFGSKDIDMNMTNLRVPVNHNYTEYDLNVASYLADRFNTLYTRYFYNFTKWMYYGQVNGVQITWPSYKTNEYSFTFDPRERPWFSQSIANSRNYIIVIDRIYRGEDSREQLVMAKNLAIKLLHTIPYGSRVSLIVHPFEVLLQNYLLHSPECVKNVYNLIIGITKYFVEHNPTPTRLLTKTFEWLRAENSIELLMVLAGDRDIESIGTGSCDFSQYELCDWKYVDKMWVNNGSHVYSEKPRERTMGCHARQRYYPRFWFLHNYDRHPVAGWVQSYDFNDVTNLYRRCEKSKIGIDNNNVHIYQIANPNRTPDRFKNLMSLSPKGLFHIVRNDTEMERAVIATYNFYKKLKFDKSYTHFVTKQYDDSNNLGKVVTMTKGFVNSNGLVSVIGIDFKYSDLVNSAFDESSIVSVLNSYAPQSGVKLEVDASNLNPSYREYNQTLHLELTNFLKGLEPGPEPPGSSEPSEPSEPEPIKTTEPTDSVNPVIRVGVYIMIGIVITSIIGGIIFHVYETRQTPRTLPSRFPHH